jgi:hypothetical protein
MRSAFLVLAVWLSMAAPAAAQSSDQLDRLKDELHLETRQAAAWSDYRAAISPSAQDQSRQTSARRMLPSLPTPRRLALMEAVMQDSQAAFRQREAATLAFYNQLTPEQQKTFDRLTAPTTPQ